MCHCHCCKCIRREYNCNGVIVHRIPSDYTFEFKHVSIPTYCLSVQSQHDIVPYSINIGAEPYVVPIVVEYQASVQLHLVMVHHMQSNDIFKFKHAPSSSKANTPFHIFNQHQHQRRAVCHYHCSWIASTGECIFAIVSWCTVYKAMTHSNSNIHQYQRTFCSFKANMTPFHLFNQHQRRTMCHCHGSWIAGEFAIVIMS